MWVSSIQKSRKVCKCLGRCVITQTNLTIKSLVNNFLSLMVISVILIICDLICYVSHKSQLVL